MKLPSLIALYSPAPESGKSTASSFLVENYGYTLVKLAGPLKAMARSFLYDLGVAERRLDQFIEGEHKNADLAAYGLPGITPRKVMQTLGSEWGRDNMGTDVWATVAARRCERLIGIGGRVVVDDLRFPNEWRILDGVTEDRLFISIHRASARSNGHPSDGCLSDDMFDEVIDNNGSIAELRESVLSVLRSS